MPRYFFDLLDGTTQCDQIGANLAGDAAAKQEAMMRALNGTAHQLEHYDGSEEIAVRNEQGKQIFKTRIKRAWPAVENAAESDEKTDISLRYDLRRGPSHGK